FRYGIKGGVLGESGRPSMITSAATFDQAPCRRWAGVIRDSSTFVTNPTLTIPYRRSVDASSLDLCVTGLPGCGSSSTSILAASQVQDIISHWSGSTARGRPQPIGHSPNTTKAGHASTQRITSGPPQGRCRRGGDPGP